MSGADFLKTTASCSGRGTTRVAVRPAENTGVYWNPAQLAEGESDPVILDRPIRPTIAQRLHQRFIAAGLLALLTAIPLAPLAFSPAPAGACHCGCASSTADCCCKKSHAAGTRWSVGRNCGSDCRSATGLPLHSVALAISRFAAWNTAPKASTVLFTPAVRSYHLSGHLAYLFQRPPPAS
jgi:hypothetical protein